MLAIAAALGACIATPAPTASAQEFGQGDSPQPAPSVPLPPGAACTAAIERWRDVIDSDYRLGYSDPTVYAAVQNDITQEQAACAAGRDQQALAMVAASRRRHGYPAR